MLAVAGAAAIGTLGALTIPSAASAHHLTAVPKLDCVGENAARPIALLRLWFRRSLIAVLRFRYWHRRSGGLRRCRGLAGRRRRRLWLRCRVDALSGVAA